MDSINTNLDALNVQNNITNAQMSYGKAIAQISSGLRINTAADDPSGLATLNSLQTAAAGTTQAESNVAQASSFLQTADGGMASMVTILNQMYSLAVESNSSATSSTDAGYNEDVFQADVTALDNFVSNTNYNGTDLLNTAATFTFQTGSASTNTSTITATDLTATIGTALTSTAAGVGSATTAALAEGLITTAIAAVDSYRASIGASEQQFQATSTYLQASSQNLSASISTVGDANIAQQTTSLATAQVLGQAANAMLAQANAQPAQVLTLLR